MSVRYLIVGGAGFIGSNMIRHLLTDPNPGGAGAGAPERVVNLDKLTYAGNLENLRDVENDSRYRFVLGDVADRPLVEEVMRNERITHVVNFAAETHVDRAILGAEHFLQTEIMGAHSLCEAARAAGAERLLQVSTDEVYGEILEGSWTEDSPVNPRNPYSAAKAGQEMLVRSYFTTYGLPTLLTRACNNFGPYQYPEKIIPLFVTNLLDDKKIPLYGDGLHVRDWIHVLDHCTALLTVLHRGTPGQIYNVAAKNEVTNKELTERMLALLGKDDSSIERGHDRPGHDRRYSMDSSKLHALGWKTQHRWPQALGETVEWYRTHETWWRPLVLKMKSFYDEWYGQKRLPGTEKAAANA